MDGMMMRYEIKFLIILIISSLVDSIWVYYIQGVADKAPHKAAISGVLIYLSSIFVTLQVIDNNLSIIPASIGAYIGTYLTVKLKNDKKIE